MIAAIDVGSNAIRLAIAETSTPNHITVKKSMREPVRLGRDVFDTGSVQAATLAKMLRAFEKFSKILKKHKVSRVRAVATSAMREAHNSVQVVQLLKETSKLNLEVIGGIEEAKLINIAVKNAIELKNKRAFLIDIGGGSLEISYLQNGKTKAVQTFPLGTIRVMSAINVRSQDTNVRTIKRFLNARRAMLQEFIERAHAGSVSDLLIGTGGNLEALGRLRVTILGRMSSQMMFKEDLDQIIKILSASSYQQRMVKFGLKPDRADVILPASLLLQMTMELMKMNDIVIPSVGLKDGVLLELSKKRF